MYFMPIRIVHTADNHIGLPCRQYPGDAALRLIDERFTALERLVTASRRSCVAGLLRDC